LSAVEIDVVVVRPAANFVEVEAGRQVGRGVDAGIFARCGAKRLVDIAVSKGEVAGVRGVTPIPNA